MKKTKLVFFAFWVIAALILSFPVFSPAEDIYESKLDKGLKNTEPYSYILIKKAQADPANAKNYLKEAAKYSPDLPVVYFESAKAGLAFSPNSMFESIDFFIQGFNSYKRNFWWLTSIAGLLFISLLSSFIIMLLIVICIRFFVETPLLSHDITEDKKKILLILFLIPLSFLGPLYFIAGALSILGLYFRKIDKAVVYISIILLLLSPLFLRLTNIFFSAPSAELRAIVDVNESRDNRFAAAILKNKTDYASLFSYGLALKREGRYEEAIAAFKNLLSSAPDPGVYVNMGNCYYGLNDLPAAQDLYRKAMEIKPLVSAYYNLSQISRETLDFVKGEEYFTEAAKIDSGAISRFVSTAGKGPNRAVVDETLPMHTMWQSADSKSQPVVKISLFGSATAVIVAMALGILFYIIDGRLRYKSYRCKRCNAVLCGVCAKELLWGQMCAQCYGSIVKLDSLDSRGRVAKVLQVQELQSRKRNVIRALSFAPPGIAYIYSGRILAGGLSLWLFLFLIVLVLLNPLFSTGLSTFSHNWLTFPSIGLLVVLYLFSNIYVLRRLNKGWL